MSAFDLNDAEPASDFGDIIPNGVICKIVGRLRPGGAGDEGLFKQSKTSDVQMLDWEFTVAEGKYARRKFWGFMTVSGGELNEKGVSKGWVITKTQLRSMVDSACGLNPKDESEAAKARRNIPSFGALDGITFIAKIGVEKGTNGYADKNKIAAYIAADKPEWQTVWNGQDIIPTAAPVAGGFGGFGAPSAAPAAAPQGGFGAPQGGFGAQPTAQAPQAGFAPAAQPAAQAPATGFQPAAGFNPAGATPAAGPKWAQ